MRADHCRIFLVTCMLANGYSCADINRNINQKELMND